MIMIELPNQMTCGDAVQVGHDDVHEDQIILRSRIHLVHRFQAVQLAGRQPTNPPPEAATYGAVDGTMDRIEKSRPDLPTRRIIFDQQNVRRSNPAGIDLRTFLPTVRHGLLGVDDGWVFRGHGVWNVVDMLTIHRVDAIGLSDWVDDDIRFDVQFGIRHRRARIRRRRRSRMTAPGSGVRRGRGHGSIGAVVEIGHVL